MAIRRGELAWFSRRHQDQISFFCKEFAPGVCCPFRPPE